MSSSVTRRVTTTTRKTSRVFACSFPTGDSAVTDGPPDASRETGRHDIGGGYRHVSRSGRAVAPPVDPADVAGAVRWEVVGAGPVPVRRQPDPGQAVGLLERDDDGLERVRVDQTGSGGDDLLVE